MIIFTCTKNDTVGISHMSIIQHMSVAMQRLVDFSYMITQLEGGTQQSCNALLARVSVGRSGTYKKNTQAEPTENRSGYYIVASSVA
jgi:hypothetical protein